MIIELKFVEFNSLGSYWKSVSIGSDNGLVLNGQQVIEEQFSD